MLANKSFDKFMSIERNCLKKKKKVILKGFLERRAELCLQEYSNNLLNVSKEQLHGL